MQECQPAPVALAGKEAALWPPGVLAFTFVSPQLITWKAFKEYQSMCSGSDIETEASSDGKELCRLLSSSLAAMLRSQCEELLRLASSVSCSTAQPQTRYLSSQVLLTPARSHVHFTPHSGLYTVQMIL